MKKALYSSTALAAASALALIPSGDALAAEKAKKISLGFGGGMKALVGFADQEGASQKSSDADTTGTTGSAQFNIWTNTEVEVKGSVKLDSGITVSVEVEFEGDQVISNGPGDDETIDHSFMRVSGGFGDIRLGSTSPVTAVLAQNAPWTGAIFPGVEDVFWVLRPDGHGVGSPGNTRNAGGKASTTNGADDVMKLQYVSPQFGGLRFGTYYSPSTNDYNEGMPRTGGQSGTEDQEYGVSLNYETKMGSVSVKTDIGTWRRRGQATESTDTLRFGARLGFGDITVGGSFMDVGNAASGVEGTAASDEEQRFDLGVLYRQKAYSVGLHYMNAVKPFSTAVAGDDEKTIVSLGGSYAMGPGVSAVGTVFWVDYEDELTTDANNNTGWAAVAGISVRF
ncbi:MAG: porin [Pseudomonadota bacterium]|nr:porin [Pseudomonadota bacterium]